MSREFSLDLRHLDRAIRMSPVVAGRGAQRAMNDIKDDWIREARDIAPLDKSNLRQQIAGETTKQLLETDVVLTANAQQRGFNYGYYIHELDAGGKSLQTTGTVKKFLDESVDESKWSERIVSEITEELRGAGW